MLAKVRKFRKRSFYRSIFFPVLMGFLVLGIIGFLVFSNLRISQRRAELTAKIEGFKKEIQDLGQKNQELQANITQTGEKDYWKEKLYQQGYVGEGEQQVVVLPPEEQTKKVEKGFWQKLLDPVRTLWQKNFSF